MGNVGHDERSVAESPSGSSATWVGHDEVADERAEHLAELERKIRRAERAWDEREPEDDDPDPTQEDESVDPERRVLREPDGETAAFDIGLQIGADTERNAARRAIAGAVLLILGKDRADGPINLGALGWWLASDGEAVETYPQ